MPVFHNIPRDGRYEDEGDDKPDPFANIPERSLEEGHRLALQLLDETQRPSFGFEERENTAVDTALAAPAGQHDAPALHKYKVGSESTTALIEAPTPFLAAMFFGFVHEQTLFFSNAVIHEVDGQPYQGAMPWLKWREKRDNGMSIEELTDIMDQIKDGARSLVLCRTVNEP